MKKKQETETPDVSVESLKNEIRQYHREQVIALLDRKVLTQVPENEKTEVYRSLTQLTNPAIMDYIVKDAGSLSADALRIDFSNLRNREFVAEMLKKHRKNLDLSGAEQTENLFRLACEINDDDTARFLLKRKGGVPDVTPLAEMNAESFGAVIASCKGQLSGTQTADLAIAVCASDQAAEKLSAMEKAGCDLKAKGSSGKSALDTVRERVREGKYKNTKEGSLAKARDRQALRVLDPKPAEKDPEAEKQHKRKRTLTITICAAVCVAVVLIIVIGNMPKRSASDAASDSAAVSAAGGAESTSSVSGSTSDTADTESTSSSASAESTAASVSSGSAETLNTDASLTVADGDRVNIDYTGYIDGKAFDGGSTNGAGTDLVIGSGTYIDDFEDQLIGHNVGETVDVNVTFPKNYGAANLAGKDATFEVTINGIYQ